MSHKLHTLRDLFVEQLKDLHSAETQLLKGMPSIARAVHDELLRTALLEHADQTRTHVDRLEQILARLGESPRGHACKAMKGLLAEAREMADHAAEPAVRDAGLIAAAQRIEHYEIAGYGCVRTYAEHLGDLDAVALLQDTLDEEGDADKQLTEIATSLNLVAEEA